MLSDGPYNKDWDDAMATDIHNRVNEMSDIVVKLKNEMKGEPKLIIPPEIDTVYEELFNVQKRLDKIYFLVRSPNRIKSNLVD